MTAQDETRRRAIDAACARHSIEHSHVTVLSSAVILVVCHLLFRGRVPEDRLLVWTTIVTTILVARVIAAWAYRRRVPTDEDLGRWVIAMAVTMTASAFTWGSLVFVPVAPDNGLAMTLAVVFAGAVAGAAQMLIGTPRTCAAVIAGHLGPLLVFLTTSGVPDHAYLAVATVVFLVFVVNVAIQNRRLLRESIALKFGNLDLVERLTKEKTRAEDARRAAERATVTKDQFLAAASHDIRQPIHAAFMFLGALEEEAVIAPSAAGLRASLVAARQMLDTLLDISKIDAGVVERVDVSCHASVLAERVASILRPVAERRGLELRVRAPAGLWFASDPVLCQSIVMNLMSNALKYTTKGAVLLSFRRVESRCRVQAWDTGIGIPPAERERIFEDFRQLDNPERDRSRGIGLGLSIAQRLARVLDTHIEVRSTEGRGSVFSFDLPLATTRPTSADDTVTLTEPAATPARLLVVDDDVMSRNGLCALLDAWGYQVASAGSVEEAGVVAARHPELDLALVDYRLPEDKTGHDAIAAITEALGRPLEVLFITGDTSPQRIREASSAGHQVMFKPVPPDVLRSAIERAATTARAPHHARDSGI